MPGILNKNNGKRMVNRDDPNYKVIQKIASLPDYALKGCDRFAMSLKENATSLSKELQSVYKQFLRQNYEMNQFYSEQINLLNERFKQTISKYPIFDESQTLNNAEKMAASSAPVNNPADSFSSEKTTDLHQNKTSAIRSPIPLNYTPKMVPVVEDNLKEIVNQMANVSVRKQTAKKSQHPGAMSTMKAVNNVNTGSVASIKQACAPATNILLNKINNKITSDTAKINPDTIKSQSPINTDVGNIKKK